MSRDCTKEQLADQACTCIANDLILKFCLPVPRVLHIKQLQSQFFVRLYEALFDKTPADISTHPKSATEEIQNMYIIITAFGHDLLLSPRKVVDTNSILQNDVNAIHELLELIVQYTENKDKENCDTDITPQETELTCIANKNDLKKDDLRPKDDFLQFVEKELSNLDALDATKRQLLKKYQQYAAFETKSLSWLKHRKTKSQILVEDAKRRQIMLSKMVAKEVKDSKRLETVRWERQQRLAERAFDRDKRLDMARLKRRQTDEVAFRRARKIRRNEGKDLVLHEVCQESLAARKSHLLSYLKNENERKAEVDRRSELRCNAVAKFYEDQFSMMATSLQTQKVSLTMQEQAQLKMVEQDEREKRKEKVRKIATIREKMLTNTQRNVNLRDREVQKMKCKIWKM